MAKVNSERSTYGRGLGRGSKGACGGERKFDGSGRGIGNRNTSKQPPKKKG